MCQFNLKTLLGDYPVTAALKSGADRVAACHARLR